MPCEGRSVEQRFIGLIYPQRLQLRAEEVYVVLYAAALGENAVPLTPQNIQPTKSTSLLPVPGRPAFSSSPYRRAIRDPQANLDGRADHLTNFQLD